MTPADLAWAIELRAKGLTTAAIGRLLKVHPVDVRKAFREAGLGLNSVRHGSTFVNGRGWI